MPPIPTIGRDVIDRPGAGSANERLVDLFIERAIDLLRLEVGTRNKVFVLLVDLEDEIVSTIGKIDPTATARVRYQRQRLAKLLDVVRASIDATFRDARTLLAQEMRELIDIEATWTGHAINAATGVEFIDAGLSTQQLTTLVSDVLIQGAPSKDWWSRQAAGLAAKFSDEMRKGVALGEPNSKLVARVRGGEGVRGIMDMSKAGAERIVRTSVQTAANVAREATYAANDDLIASLMWHATLDTRTSVWCITRDGKNYSPKPPHAPIGKAPPWLEGPGKIHWCCRSTSVPVIKSWRDLGIDVDEVPLTTRASINGQVPESLKFEEWLRKQSKDRQEQVLGVGKAELWRAGKISFADLLDQNGRPLTTEELRAKAARK